MARPASDRHDVATYREHSRGVPRAVDEKSGEWGLGASRAVHHAVLRGGRSSRLIADLLHGTWLGHPLHPVLTDLTIGAWTLGALFDALAEAGDDDQMRKMADRLTEVGTASAVPTALAGLADYSTVPKNAAGTGALHAVLNSASLGLYLMSLRDRRRGRRRRGLALSAVALGANMFSAWLGGHLVYRERVGVDHSDRFDEPRRWTPVMRTEEIGLGEAKRIKVHGKPVMIYRDEQGVYALGAVCSHAGGPLDEGEVRDCFVRCPWHDSVFDMRDGSIEHGPATTPQAAFDARVTGEDIELRVRTK